RRDLRSFPTRRSSDLGIVRWCRADPRIWCGVVWWGVVWSGVVCGVVWCGVVWCRADPSMGCVWWGVVWGAVCMLLWSVGCGLWCVSLALVCGCVVLCGWVGWVCCTSFFLSLALARCRPCTI